MKQPRVSLCMILRDEQDLLLDCLESARPVVDEIVALIDDRTTDATAEIARGYGARVLPYRWRDDFAAARNASIDAARGAWVLVLDADDRLLPAGVRAVEAAVGRGRRYGDTIVHGYVFEISERDRQGHELVRAQSSGRLFPRRRQLRYVGSVHEEVFYLPEPGATRWAQIEGGPHIAHLGYDRELFTARGKDARNVNMLMRRHELEPDNPYVAFYLAKHHWWMRRYAVAAYWAGEALRPELISRLQPDHRRELWRIADAWRQRTA